MRPAPPYPRLPDWPERLTALVEARRDTPFAWGCQDCCLFAADAVLAITGRDPAAAWRGCYADEAGAEALLAAAGGLETLAQAVLARFGAAECPPALAQRGDVVLARLGNADGLGVVLGQDIAAPALRGLAFLPFAAARRAWVV